MGGSFLFSLLIFVSLTLKNCNAKCQFKEPEKFIKTFVADGCLGKEVGEDNCRFDFVHEHSPNETDSPYTRLWKDEKTGQIVRCGIPARTEATGVILGDVCSRIISEDLVPNCKKDEHYNECLRKIECVCNGNECTSNLGMTYIAAKLQGAPLQIETLALYRFSIYENLTTDGSLNPENYAARHNASKATTFNPRIRSKRELFQHLRNMFLAIGCIIIATAAFYKKVSGWINKLNGKKRKTAKVAQPRLSREAVAESPEDAQIEEYLRGDHLLFAWSRPQQLLTPFVCFPKGFGIDQGMIQEVEEKPVRCNQTKEYLIVSA